MNALRNPLHECQRLTGKVTIYKVKASLGAKIRPGRKCPSTALWISMGRRGQDRGTEPGELKKDKGAAENRGGIKYKVNEKKQNNRPECIRICVNRKWCVYVY